MLGCGIVAVFATAAALVMTLKGVGHSGKDNALPQVQV